MTLIDPKFTRSTHTAQILSVIHGDDVIPQKIGTGLYLAKHWNAGGLAIGVRERWKEKEFSMPPFDEHGVVDFPEQLLQKVDLASIPERVFVSFVRIDKDKSNAGKGGGWRWHKWGEYIGDKQPQCEYLDDEPEIDTVYTFSIHELLP